MSNKPSYSIKNGPTKVFVTNTGKDIKKGIDMGLKNEKPNVFDKNQIFLILINKKKNIFNIYRKNILFN